MDQRNVKKNTRAAGRQGAASRWKQNRNRMSREEEARQGSPSASWDRGEREGGYPEERRGQGRDQEEGSRRGAQSGRFDSDFEERDQREENEEWGRDYDEGDSRRRAQSGQFDHDFEEDDEKYRRRIEQDENFFSDYDREKERRNRRLEDVGGRGEESRFGANREEDRRDSQQDQKYKEECRHCGSSQNRKFRRSK